MPIPTNYVRLTGTPEDVAQRLGPLAPLVGKWVGTKGWNLIALPGPGTRPSTGGPFTVLLQQYTETLTFTPIGAPVRNRGGAEDQFITGLLYEQTVNDLTTGETLHVENGTFLNLASVVNNDGTRAPSPPFAFARTASIPHGNSMLVLGNAEVGVRPSFTEEVSALPPDLGPQMPLSYLDAYGEAVKGTPFDVNDVDSTLREHAKGQDIVSTSTITLSSKNDGGILNVPFIEKFADTTRFDGKFWIENVRRDDGAVFLQLQYRQISELAFFPKAGAPGLIKWPHPNVNSLVKV